MMFLWHLQRVDGCRSAWARKAVFQSTSFTSVIFHISKLSYILTNHPYQWFQIVFEV